LSTDFLAIRIALTLIDRENPFWAAFARKDLEGKQEIVPKKAKENKK
jgi:hypothetical protein